MINRVTCIKVEEEFELYKIQVKKIQEETNKSISRLAF